MLLAAVLPTLLPAICTIASQCDVSAPHQKTKLLPQRMRAISSRLEARRPASALHFNTKYEQSTASDSPLIRLCLSLRFALC